MKKINIVAVGSLKENFFKQAQDEYLKRLKKYCEINVVELAEKSHPQKPSESEINKALDFEAESILPHLKGKVVVCAVEGKGQSSEEFARTMGKAFDSDGQITFVVGSSYGLSQKIKENNTLLSFSSMTFPHHLMRIFLEEQIYRAFTILSGQTYHK